MKGEPQSRLFPDILSVEFGVALNEIAELLLTLAIQLL
jgi:hypothetical protein